MTAPPMVQAVRKARPQPKPTVSVYDAAGLDEGFLSLSLHILVYMENPYSYKKCQ